MATHKTPASRGARLQRGSVMLMTLYAFMVAMAYLNIGMTRSLSDMNLASLSAQRTRDLHRLDGAIDAVIASGLLQQRGNVTLADSTTVNFDTGGTFTFLSPPADGEVTTGTAALPQGVLINDVTTMPAGTQVTAQPIALAVDGTIWQFDMALLSTNPRAGTAPAIQVIIKRKLPLDPGAGVYASGQVIISHMTLTDGVKSNGPIGLYTSQVTGDVISAGTTPINFAPPGGKPVMATIFTNGDGGQTKVKGDLKTNTTAAGAIYLSNHTQVVCNGPCTGTNGGHAKIGKGGVATPTTVVMGVDTSIGGLKAPWGVSATSLSEPVAQFPIYPPAQVPPTAVRGLDPSAPCPQGSLTVTTTTTLPKGNYCSVTVGAWGANVSLTIPDGVTIQNLSTTYPSSIKVPAAAAVTIGQVSMTAGTTFEASTAKQVGIRQLSTSVGNAGPATVNLPGGAYAMEQFNSSGHGGATVTFNGNADLFITKSMHWQGSTTLKTADGKATSFTVYLVDGAPLDGWESGGVSPSAHRIVGSIYGPQSDVGMSYYYVDGVVIAKTFTTGWTNNNTSGVNAYKDDPPKTVPAVLILLAWRQTR